MTAREKLLEAIDGAIESLSDELLVDILLDQLKRLKADLVEARLAVSKEAERAHDAEELCRAEIHRAKTDPIYGAEGVYYFVGSPGQPTYVLTISGRDIQLARSQNRVDYALQRVTAQEYERRNS